MFRAQRCSTRIFIVSGNPEKCEMQAWKRCTTCREYFVKIQVGAEEIVVASWSQKRSWLTAHCDSSAVEWLFEKKITNCTNCSCTKKFGPLLLPSHFHNSHNVRQSRAKSSQATKGPLKEAMGGDKVVWARAFYMAFRDFFDKNPCNKQQFANFL